MKLTQNLARELEQKYSYRMKSINEKQTEFAALTVQQDKSKKDAEAK